MDLLSDLRGMLQSHLASNGIVHAPRADVRTLLHLALNYDMKNIQPMPRQIFRSREFEQKRLTLDSTQQQALGDIIAKFQHGDDVAGHLSKSSARPEETDYLLAAWDIFHLHISNHKTNPTDRFFARTGPVMFVHITDLAAYFIDIYPHGPGFPETWTRQELLAIVDCFWPHLLDPFRQPEIIALANTPTDLELQQLRRAQLNPILPVGTSAVTSPGGGVTTSGTPTRVVIRANKTLQTINNLEREVTAKLATLKASFTKEHGIPEAAVHFELVSLGNAWAVCEKNTKLIVARSDS
jgi:hypothetical protein